MSEHSSASWDRMYVPLKFISKVKHQVAIRKQARERLSDGEEGVEPVQQQTESNVTLFDESTLLWVPDDEQVVLVCKPVEAFERGSPGTVELTEGPNKTTIQVSEKLSQSIRVVRDDLENPASNLVKLNDMHELAVFHTLRQRYSAAHIYTTIDNVLISVNPYKETDLYSEENLSGYLHHAVDQINGGVAAANQPPHVYSVATRAYINMVQTGENQSCVISGESGAGKTEATKVFLGFLIALASQQSIGAAPATHLCHRILESNPLLEAFGNAKTVRNDNSSRFGKLVKLEFDNRASTGGSVSVHGCTITTYLLEKSRVCLQSVAERNFHVFYQILRARDTCDLLGGIVPENVSPEDFFYLAQGCTEVKGIDDVKQWVYTRDAIRSILGADEQQEVIQILLGILYVGNVTYVCNNDDTLSIADKSVVSKAAEYLGVEDIVLEEFLLFKFTVAPLDVIKTPYDKQGATHARDVLAKSVYSTLFDHLVNVANKTFNPSRVDEQSVDESRNFVGVLDIYGFESFEHNSFEQLCINYCNEKLQQFFCSHVLEREIEESKSEGVTLLLGSELDEHPVLVQNASVIQLFDGVRGKSSGILGLVDEEVQRSGNDSNLLAKLNKKIASEMPTTEKRPPKRRSSSMERREFMVVHFAGQVTYSVDGFVEKNSDKVPTQLSECLATSKHGILKLKFDTKHDDTKALSTRRSTGSKKSILSKFRAELNALCSFLGDTEPHFIRCIKPNTEKKPDMFVSPMVLSQLRFSGVMDVCQIRKHGYPTRLPFRDFVGRFGALAGVLLLDNGDEGLGAATTDLCASFERNGVLVKHRYKMGTSKVFLKTSQIDGLESRRFVFVQRIATAQAQVRRRLVQAKYSTYQALCAESNGAKTVDEMQAAVCKWDALAASNSPVSDVASECVARQNLLTKLSSEKQFRVAADELGELVAEGRVLIPDGKVGVAVLEDFKDRLQRKLDEVRSHGDERLGSQYPGLEDQYTACIKRVNARLELVELHTSLTEICGTSKDRLVPGNSKSFTRGVLKEMKANLQSVLAGMDRDLSVIQEYNDDHMHETIEAGYEFLDDVERALVLTRKESSESEQLGKEKVVAAAAAAAAVGGATAGAAAVATPPEPAPQGDTAGGQQGAATDAVASANVDAPPPSSSNATDQASDDNLDGEIAVQLSVLVHNLQGKIEELEEKIRHSTLPVVSPADATDEAVGSDPNVAQSPSLRCKGCSIQ